MSKQASQSIISAGKWFARLSSEEAKPADYEAWQAWKASDPANEQAWAQVEALTRKFSGLPSNIGSDTLLKPSRETRRLVLKQIALFIGMGAMGTVAYQQKPWQGMLADQTVETGQTREVTLADGSRLFINTDSAVNLSFSEHERAIELIRGEIYVETAVSRSTSQPRLSVTTRHGRFVALGTKFNVRDHGSYSRVSVYEGTVEISPEANPQLRHRVPAGQSGVISRQDMLGISDGLASRAWTKGMLVVFDMPLPEFVNELSRYRPGVIRCDPALAHLKVTGNFLTSDIDAVLSHLSSIFPIRIESFTRYWVSLHAT